MQSLIGKWWPADEASGAAAPKVPPPRITEAEARERLARLRDARTIIDLALDIMQPEARDE